MEKCLHLKLTPEQQSLLFNTSGRLVNGKKNINVSGVYSASQEVKNREAYDKLQVEEFTEDDAIDAAGYTGNFRREVNKNAVQISEREFVAIFEKNNKLDTLMEMIREIDRDHNGYVTSTEMEDMLKIIYPVDLANKNFRNLLKPYCSSANKILLDYKLFREFIQNGLRGEFKDHGAKLKPNLLKNNG